MLNKRAEMLQKILHEHLVNVHRIYPETDDFEYKAIIEDVVYVLNSQYLLSEKQIRELKDMAERFILWISKIQEEL